MSYRVIYADMLKKGYSKVIVFEDDIKIISENFKEFYKVLTRQNIQL